MQQFDVIIAGGGITGLSCAYFLSTRAPHLKILLIEKRERLGGNIITEKIGEFVVEGGPDCFISEKPWALKLIREIGLEGDVIGTIPENNRTFIYSGGKLHPLPEGFMLLVPTKITPFVFSSLISWKGKFRALLDLVIPRAKSDDETLEEFVTRRLGREMLEKIAEPLIAGIHAADPSSMSVKAAFPRFIELERRHRSLIIGMLKMKRRAAHHRHKTGTKAPSMFLTLKGGMAQLTDRISQIIRSQKNVTVLLATELQTFNLESQHFAVKTSKGTFKSQALVIATPAHVASRITAQVHSHLSEALAQIPFTSTVTLSAAFKKSQTQEELNGYGFLIPRAEGGHLLAATWTSSKFPFRSPPSHHLIRCFGGGYRDEKFVECDENHIISVLLDEFSNIMGWKTSPEFVKVYKWKKAMPQYTRGHLERVQNIEALEKEIPGLFLSGSSYRGVGISDCVRDAEETSSKVLAFLSTKEKLGYNNVLINKGV